MPTFPKTIFGGFTVHSKEYDALSPEYRQALNEQFDYVLKQNFLVLNVLRQYSSGDYRDINKALRTGISDTKVGKITGLTIDQKIRVIDETFENAPPLKHSIVVYRGMVGKLSSQLGGAYISTSLSAEIPSSFKKGGKCCLYEIYIPAGTKVLPLMHISRIPKEQELLLPRTGSLFITAESNDKGMEIFKCVYLPHNTVALVPPKTKTKSPKGR